MPQQVERKHIPLPEQFVLAKHRVSLENKVNEKFGDGWVLKAVSNDNKTATFERGVSVTQVSETEKSVEIKLSDELSKPSAGDQVAARYEDRFEGFYLTKFDPHLSRARMTKLTPGAVRTRKAMSVALGCKPWEVQIATMSDGGYEIKLPDTYMPSKHDTKLEEVTTSVAGQIGWRFQADPATLSARMIPGEPPLFPEAVHYPMKRLGPGDDIDRTLVGVLMPEEGTGVGEELYLDWTASAFGLCGGLPQSGKSVLLNSIIAQQLAAGAKLVIVDDFSKAVDFDWCKPYVRPGGWGCDSEKQAVAVLAMVHEEGQRRAAKLREMGLNNWLDMPADQRFDPIVIIVDELSALLMLDPVPKGVSKDNPVVRETNELNFSRQMIARWINKIIAEQRFVGMRMILSTQITNANTGLPPSTKGKIGHRVLQGASPSKPQRDQMFNDEKTVPSVPLHVQSSGKNARGVGVAHLDSQAPAVYKSLFASVGEYRDRFKELGLPTTEHPEPTSAQIAKYAPDLDDEDYEPAPRAETPSGKPLDPKFGPTEQFAEDGSKLFGAAAAAAGSKKIAASAASEAKAKPGPPCPACGLPINDGCTC